MSEITLAFTIQPALAPAADSEQVQTSFGAVHWRERPGGSTAIELFDLGSGHDHRALAVAARKLGASRLLAVATDAEVVAPCFPTDYLDFSSNRPTTFFEQSGYGYLSQDPPFCPEMIAALSHSGAIAASNLAVLDALPEESAREWWHRHGVDLFTSGSQPLGLLARELGLCVAVLCLPDNRLDSVLIGQLATLLAVDRNCSCHLPFTKARERGILAEAWEADLLRC